MRRRYTTFFKPHNKQLAQTVSDLQGVGNRWSGARPAQSAQRSRFVVWVIIIVIMIVAFGPIFWLMPSARERRLSALRQRAYRHGMRVELRRLPGRDVPPEERVTAGGRELDTSREYAAYSLPLGARLRLLPTWRVLRGGEGMSAVPGWAFEPGRRPEDPRLAAVLDAVAPVLVELPEDVVAVECEPHAVAAYWLEGRGADPQRVDDLAQRLGTLADALRALDQRLEAETRPPED